MEENKFERQVRQKMDELKIHPSDAVWEKIEARIEKKKRSNRGVLWFGVLFFVFLTGGYLLWNNGQQSISGNNHSEKENSATASSENTTKEIAIKKKENKTTQPETNSISNSIKQENNTVDDTALNNNSNKISPQYYQRIIAKRGTKIKSGGKVAIAFSKPPETEHAISENADAKHDIVKQEDIQAGNEKIVSDIKDGTTDKVKDSLLKQPLVVNENAGPKDTAHQLSASSQTAKHIKKSKWRPGFLLSGGLSRVGNDFLGFSNTFPLAYLSAIVQRPPPYNAPGAAPLPTPSRAKSSFGFMAGVFVEKNISKKVILQTGISFKSFNTSTKVGTRNDSTGSYYTGNSYANYNTHNYNSHYNFVELPVTLKVQIGKGQNAHWFWQGGVVVSQLISSNALQFNEFTGTYYRDNSIFDKTQVGLNTAFSASLFPKQKNSVLIGPYFYYSLSSLAKEGLYNKKHFVFTGLRTEIIFGK